VTPEAPRKSIIFFLIFAFLFSGCASKGLLTDRYTHDEVSIPRLLPEDTSDMNPTFIVIGDEQMGRRVVERFGRVDMWATWWQLAVPFYQAYLLYNGVSGGINWLRHVPDEGLDTRIMMRDVLYRDVERVGADFILNTGDITAADGRRPNDWEMFLENKKWSHPFSDEIPYVPTIGNHEWANDSTTGWDNYQAVFSYPRFYSLEFEHLALIVLDSNYLIDQWKLIEPADQEKLYREWFVSEDGSSWLEQTLAQYADKKYLAVSMHHPPITYGWHYKDWYKESYGSDLARKRGELLDVFDSYGVQVVFSGHEHLYQHSVVETSEIDPVSQLHFITSSGGGVPIRSSRPDRKIESMLEQYRVEGLNVGEPLILGEYHYCVVSMDADSLIVETMQVDQEHDDHAVTLFDRAAIPAK
jgi:Calcineurin-like phosphoesterase